jgi:hypothetical protein
MKIDAITKSSLIAVGIGAFQYFLLLYSFSLLLTYVNPFGLLVGLGLRGSIVYFVSGVFDLIWAVLFSIPAAIILLKLRPRKIWLYLFLAVIPAFVWLNIGLVANPIFSEYWGGLLVGWINELLPLPLAVLILQKSPPWKTHNKSFNADASSAGAG